MATLIHIDSVSIQLGARELFHDLSLIIPTRARLGIVGPNGTGKSTLLRAIAGEIEPDSGRIIQGSGVRVSYVPQMESFEKDETVMEAVLRKVSSTGHDSEVSAAKALSQAGFQNLHQPTYELSGGWRKRLSLAAALSEQPELLLLDEPTNHLDLEGLAWLEGVLSTALFGWVLVSHDRYFLDRTVTKIVELSPIFQQGYFESEGTYFDFKRNREQLLEQEAKRTSALANRARRELEWASRSPKARTGKASYRMKEAQRLKQELRAAKSRQPQKQKVTSFHSSGRGTKELVQIIKCSFSYDTDEIIQKLNYTLKNGMCLGLLGSNGQGKSTLLKLIGGSLSPSSGKVKIASGLKVVYFDQLRETLTTWRTLGELLGEGHDHVIYRGKPAHIIGWGRRFGFEPEDHIKLLSSLSGGEQARALLSVLVRQEADLLLLDEPTNDLDISMLEALEAMILEFEGAVVLVTHDRFMLDEVCTNFLGFSRTGELVEYASFEQWFEKESTANGKSSSRSSETKESSKRTNNKQPLQKLSYKDQHEYGKIEGRILKAEKRLSVAEVQATDPAVHADQKKSIEVSQELAEAKQEVERLYHRWEELDALKREIEKGRSTKS